MNEIPRGGTAPVTAAMAAWLLIAAPVVGGLAIAPGVVAGADAAGSVDGTPHLTASAPNARFDPGQSGTIGVTITNNATYDYGGDQPPEGAIDRAGEAQSVTVNISDTNVSGAKAAPLTVETGPQNVGTVADGVSSGPHQFNVVVDEDARAGTYELNVTTTYDHYRTVNYTQDTDGDYTYTPKNQTSRTETDTITVVVEPQADFEVTETAANVPLGGEGTLSVRLNNTGTETVTDATVTLSSQDSDVYFGSGTATTEAYAGSWNGSETKRLTFRAGTTDSAVKREYPIDVSVDYTDSDGASASDSTQIGVTPGQRDHFRIRGVSHDVPENGEGTMTVAVDQTWKRELVDVQVTASTSATDVSLGTSESRSATTFVENWGSWDEQDLEFRVRTDDASLDRTYPIELQFEYTDRNDNQNTQTQYVHFTPTQREFFEVESVTHDVPRNGVGTLSVEMEQKGDQDFEDVAVTAATEDSAVYLGTQGSTSATRMVGNWEENEDERVTFRVGTVEEAVKRPYPLDLTVEYTDEDDNDNSRTKTVDFTPGAADHLAVVDLNHHVPRDGVGPLRVVLKNTAGKPLTDLSVTASAADSEIYLGSESSRSGSATVDRLQPGENRTVTYQVGATANAVNRTYPLDLSMEYTDGDNNANQQTETVAFRPDPAPRFRVTQIDHQVPVGGSGRIAITLRNEGPLTATDTVVTASSEADAMYLGTGGTEPVEMQGVAVEPPQTGTPTARTYVGNWSAGETRTVHFRAGFEEDAIVREYVTELAFDYDNPSGDEMPQRSRAVGFEPLPEQQFAVEPLESDLHVGEEGDLVVNVTNAAGRSVDGVVLTVESPAANVNLYNARYALGRLSAGESASARFRVGVTGEAEPGPKVFELSGRYRDPQGEVQQSASRDLLTRVGPDRNAFALSVTDAAFRPGESGTFQVAVTNRRNETLSDVQARLFTDDPLDSEDDSAFIDTIQPGETERITLDLSVAGTASEKTYSAALDFRFDDERGDSVLSDTQRIPITVRESGSNAGPLFAIGVVVLVGLGIVGVRRGYLDQLRALYRDRRGN